MKALAMVLGLSFLLAASARADGTYSFPGSDALLAVSTWQVPDASFTHEDGKAELRYTLPARLTGNVHRIEISLTGDFSDGYASVSGPLGRGSCVESSAGTMCLVAMRALSIRLAEVEDFLRETSASEEEFFQRLEVAAAFEHEPIGILNLK
jgi:hypothetical protein